MRRAYFVYLFLCLTTFAALPAQAQSYSYSVLYSFQGQPDGNPGLDGAGPDGLVRDAHGNLYGNTVLGGDLACPLSPGSFGCGTVFKLDPDGNKTVLYAFTGTGGDGAMPVGGLVRDAHGNLYGTTYQGGNLACPQDVDGRGCGIVFKVDTAGKETILYSFTGTSGDGAEPAAGLTLDAQGNLYGTTQIGGAYGDGTVFELDNAGEERVLYSFTGAGGDGANPEATLTRDEQGNLYGATDNGGIFCFSYSFFCGTVFEVYATGGETVLYAFTGNDGNGWEPYSAGLVRDAHGNLYGTTLAGGDYECDSGFGCGTVFKVDPAGIETTLYSFTGTGGDGAEPCGGVIPDAQGNLYGTTDGGGAYGHGTVFRLGTTGNLTLLYSFTGSDGDGSSPQAGLVRDNRGNLYGTTEGGGASGMGTVFELSPLPATTTTLTSSPNPSTYGEPVTFTAVVTSKAGTPPDGETVGFMQGKTLLGTGALSGGSASVTTSTLAPGNNPIMAVYGGDLNFGGSTSKTVKQVVETQAPYGIVSPTALNFGSVVLGQTSPPLLVSLTNFGNSELTVSDISISWNFALPRNQCANGVKPGTHCNVSVTYTPHALETDTGTLTFTDNASNSPQTVLLTGTGVN